MKKNGIIMLVFFLLLSSLTAGYYFISKNTKVKEEVQETVEQGEFHVPDYNLVPGELAADWTSEYRVIAHALGGIDQYEYTNSLDAFYANYEMGTRVFEVDYEVTADGDLVLTHTWEDFRNKLTDMGGDEPLTTEEFKAAKIHGRYRTVTFEDLLDLMIQYPDFYVIVDSKTFDEDSTRRIYGMMMDAINAKDPELVHRFIPQAYDAWMIEILQNEYSFDQIIFTLYSVYSYSDPYALYEEVRDYNIPIVVCHMDNDWATKVISDIYAYSIMEGRKGTFKVYIHTVNDYEKTRSIIEDYHFDGVYTDFITEVQMNKDILKGE